MQTSQEILLLLPHKRLLPFLTYVLQHLRRIIITIPALGLHKIILGRQKTDLPANLTLHCLQSRLPRINCQASFCLDRSQINKENGKQNIKRCSIVIIYGVVIVGTWISFLEKRKN